MSDWDTLQDAIKSIVYGIIAIIIYDAYKRVEPKLYKRIKGDSLTERTQNPWFKHLLTWNIMIVGLSAIYGSMWLSLFLGSTFYNGAGIPMTVAFGFMIFVSVRERRRIKGEYEIHEFMLALQKGKVKWRFNNLH